MNQRNALILFITGLTTFLSSLAEYFSAHQTWHEMGTPLEVAHILYMVVTFLMMISGALSFQIPRNAGNYTDRVSDTKLKDINTNGSEH